MTFLTWPSDVPGTVTRHGRAEAMKETGRQTPSGTFMLGGQ